MDEIGVFTVIVLYKTKLEECKTMISLQNALERKTSLLVFDNSPIRQYEEDNFELNNFIIQYHHEPSNPGLSAAYNYSLSLAKKKTNYKWLLLLDQDTILSSEYINEIIVFNFNKITSNVVAIIPRVVSTLNHKIIAPVKALIGGIFRPVIIDSGEVKNKISGINSGTLLKISYLDTINGFSKDYTLDMLDHWYFRKIYEDNKSVYLLKSTIHQNLSVFSSFEENVSFWRYKQMIEAELKFVREDGFLSVVVYKLRLIARISKQVKYKNKEYLRLTVNQIFRIK